jgi:hypothetical protein
MTLSNFFVALLTIFSFILPAFAAEPGLNETIEKLLTTVEKSDVKFVRNGDEHSGKAAVEHMRKKWDHFKKKIKTPEDFIERCASKSELSDKPYKIKLADGKMVDSKEWMLARLAEIRKGP